MSENHALILFGHGARDPEWAAPLRDIRMRLIRLSPGLRVELAFLEFMQPTLQEQVSLLVHQGLTRITVIPMFIAQGGHLKRELPVMMEELGRVHPDIQFQLTPAIGTADRVLQAMAEQALTYQAIP